MEKCKFITANDFFSINYSIIFYVSRKIESFAPRSNTFVHKSIIFQLSHILDVRCHRYPLGDYVAVSAMGGQQHGRNILMLETVAPSTAVQKPKTPKYQIFHYYLCLDAFSQLAESISIKHKAHNHSIVINKNNSIL